MRPKYVSILFFILLCIPIPSIGMSCNNFYYQAFLANPTEDTWDKATVNVSKTDPCYSLIKSVNDLLNLYGQYLLPNCQALAEGISCDQHIATIKKSIKENE